MKLTELHLAQFRGFGDAHFVFDGEVLLIHGPNGSGKTSLLEAIAYLSLPRSFRGVPDPLLVQRGRDGFTLTGRVENGGSHVLKIQYVLPGREPGKTKRVWINGKRASSMKDLFERFVVLPFTPEDLGVLTGEREQRRRFMDRMIALLDPSYYSVLTAYHRALKQRNRLLREGRGGTTEERAFREKLLNLTHALQNRRKEVLARFVEQWEKRLPMFFPATLPIRMEYEPSLPAPERDRFARTTTWGAHRDHYAFLLEDREPATFLSHSELKLLLLSLYLAWVDLFREQGKVPVLVVDELLSTLSEDRLPAVLDAVDGMQCFLTHHRPLPYPNLSRIALGQGAGVAG